MIKYDKKLQGKKRRKKDVKIEIHCLKVELGEIGRNLNFLAKNMMH